MVGSESGLFSICYFNMGWQRCWAPKASGFPCEVAAVQGTENGFFYNAPMLVTETWWLITQRDGGGYRMFSQGEAMVMESENQWISTWGGGGERPQTGFFFHG